MLTNKNQSGFAPIIIVLAVVLVAATSFTAYRLVSNNSDESGFSQDTTILDDRESTSKNANDGTGIVDNSSDSESSNDSSSDGPSENSESTSNGANSNSDKTSTSSPGTSSGGSSGGSSGSSSNGGESNSQTKAFTINSFSFGYSMSTINVSPGDVVTINLTNSGGKHDWVVDEINGAATAIINGGQTDSITFTVPKSAAGKTYKFYCSVGNHRALGMEGNFVVSS